MLNRCEFIGRLGADPEIRRTQDGRPIANLRLAVSETWRDKHSGERRERTTWVPVVIFSEGLAKVAEEYLRKGSLIYVSGAFSVRKWQDQSGQDRYSTEVVLQNFNSMLTMLDSKSDDSSSGRGRGYGSGYSRDGRANTEKRQSQTKRDYGANMDEEIPF